MEYGGLEAVLEWCRDNCVGRWRYDPVSDNWPPEDHNFWFEDDRDLMRFHLRWL
jgi:hypothetical protein